MTIPAPSIDLLWQPGVDEKYFNAAWSALRRATVALGIADKLPVVTIGTHVDIETIISAARATSASIGKPGRANGIVPGIWLEARRWRPAGWRGFSMLIVNDDLSDVSDTTTFGLADTGVGATVSTYGVIHDPPAHDPLSVFESVVIHEFGHVLNAADPDRGSAIELNLGPHCMNDCVMLQEDEDDESRLFCDQCVRDVRKFLGGYFAG